MYTCNLNMESNVYIEHTSLNKIVFKILLVISVKI